MHIGQAEIAAGVAVGELLVIEAQQVQDRGVQVVDVDRVFDGLEAEFVGRAVDVARLSRRRRPSTCVKPYGLWSRPLPALALRQLTVGVRPNSPPQMTSVLVEQAALLQVLSSAGDGLIASSRQCVRWFASMSSWLSHGCPSPCQTCTNRTPRSTSRRAMRICRPCTPGPYISRMWLRLAADIEGVGRFHLHAIGQLEGLHAGFELRRRRRAVARACRLSDCTQIELPPLLGRRSSNCFDVLDQLFDIVVLAIDVRALIDAGQKAGLPVLRSPGSDSRRGTWR